MQGQQKNPTIPSLLEKIDLKNLPQKKFISQSFQTSVRPTRSMRPKKPLKAKIILATGPGANP